MKNLIAKLPTEISDLILEYQGYHRWRNGKYMRPLCLEDTKYDELKRKPVIKLDKNNVYKASFIKIKNKSVLCYTISTSIYSNKIHWNMDLTRRPLTPHLTHNFIYVHEHYVHEHNDKQHLPVIKFRL
jgi:hypothetical protein